MMDVKELKEVGLMAHSLVSDDMFEAYEIGRQLKNKFERMGYQITKKPEAWNGEGLPPVGEYCEARWLVPPDGGSPEWVRGTFKGVYEGLAWFGCYEEVVHHVHNFEFRPIRTEEEKLKEQAYNAMSDEPLQGNEMDDKDLLSYAESLVAAGWRPNN